MLADETLTVYLVRDSSWRKTAKPERRTGPSLSRKYAGDDSDSD